MEHRTWNRWEKASEGRGTSANVNIHRPKRESITQNKDANTWIDKYLGVGEWVMDQSVVLAATTGYFEKK